MKWIASETELCVAKQMGIRVGCRGALGYAFAGLGRSEGGGADEVRGRECLARSTTPDKGIASEPVSATTSETMRAVLEYPLMRFCSITNC